MFDNVQNWQYTEEDKAAITDLTFILNQILQLSQVSTYLDLFDDQLAKILLVYSVWKDESHNPQTLSNMAYMSAPAIVGLFHPAAGRGAEHGIVITVMTTFKYIRGFSMHLQTWYQGVNTACRKILQI